jgi:hypothetical protein
MSAQTRNANAMSAATKTLRYLWTNSPRDIVKSLRFRLSSAPQQRQGQDRYTRDLVELLWQFISNSFPDEALPHDKFVNTLISFLDDETTWSHSAYSAELWSIFAPDYRRKLDEYYKSTEFHRTMRFLTYTTNPKFIHDNYLHPYQVARKTLGKLSILEVGGGIPHGLIYTCLYEDKHFCQSLTLIEIESVYKRFVDWFCQQNNIPFTLIPAVASKTTTLPSGTTYNFIFAKDVFEHLENPKEMLEELLAHAADQAVLALDLKDRDEVIYDHISIHLSPLKTLLNERGYKEFDHSGRISLYRKA